jgi:hypothetical protein
VLLQHHLSSSPTPTQLRLVRSSGDHHSIVFVGSHVPVLQTHGEALYPAWSRLSASTCFFCPVHLLLLLLHEHRHGVGAASRIPPRICKPALSSGCKSTSLSSATHVQYLIKDPVVPPGLGNRISIYTFTFFFLSLFLAFSTFPQTQNRQTHQRAPSHLRQQAGCPWHRQHNHELSLSLLSCLGGYVNNSKRNEMCLV